MKANKVRLILGLLKRMGRIVFKNLHLKEIFTFVIFLISTQLFGQSNEEAEVLKISKDIFRWEEAGKIDSLASIFDQKLVVVGSNGTKRSKEVYLDDLRKGKPVHNKIEVQENSAIVNGTKAILIGKGIFNVTANGNPLTLYLSYMEVFVMENKSWKLIALYANRLPE